MDRKPKWIKAERIEREAVFELKAEAARVFPLLCPVLEYEWIPDWRCTMLYSESGVAEKDGVFTTRQFGKKTLWCCITYEPPRLVEYILAMGSGALVRLSIRLEETGASTRVIWTMRFTMTRLNARLASGVTSEAGFEAMTGARRRQLEAYFADH